MEKQILLHKENIEKFISRLSEMNQMLAKKNQPKVDFYIASIEDCDIFGINLYSEMTSKNIKGIDVTFEGVVDLINKDEESKVFHVNNPLIHKLLLNCSCDECHKKIGRNKYLVFSKGEVKSREDLIVLGSKCARNYFPFSVESYLGNLEYVFDEIESEYDERSGSCSYLNNSVDAELLYKAVCDATDNLSFYHKEGETKTDVCNLVFDRKYRPSEPKIPFSEIREYLLGAYAEADSEFTMNVRSVMMKDNVVRDRIEIKQLGIAIYSFIGAKLWHDREVEKKIAEERRIKEGAVIEYFGNIGDKFEKELVFDKCFGYETDFGYSYILLFHDSDNHVFKWSTANGTYKAWCKTNGNSGYSEYEVGKKYTIRGSIKAHSEYRGVKQTVITRCKVIKDEYESHVFSEKEIQKKPTESDDYEAIFGTLQIA